MDRERWTLVLDAIKRADRFVGWNGGRRAPVYGNWLIVAMYVWSVWHDRTLSWACRRDSYHGLFRPRSLPSISQFTRRIKSEDCQRILQFAHDAFAQRERVTDVAVIDGKPLLVSPVSGDRDAKRGKISGGFGKGYKLHAVINESCRIVVWSVMGLNVDEKTVARQVLLPLIAPTLSSSPDAIALADSHYDSAPLHADTLEPLEICLVHPLAGQAQIDGKNRARKLKRMPSSRRALVYAWRKYPELMNYVLKLRAPIERVFGTLTCTAGGLSGLPSWVRGLDRVTRWVGTKIIFYNAGLELRERTTSNIAA